MVPKLFLHHSPVLRDTLLSRTRGVEDSAKVVSKNSGVEITQKVYLAKGPRRALGVKGVAVTVKSRYRVAGHLVPGGWGLLVNPPSVFSCGRAQHTKLLRFCTHCSNTIKRHSQLACLHKYRNKATENRCHSPDFPCALSGRKNRSKDQSDHVVNCTSSPQNVFSSSRVSSSCLLPAACLRVCLSDKIQPCLWIKCSLNASQLHDNTLDALTRLDWVWLNN